jgi:hypothetical protein
MINWRALNVCFVMLLVTLAAGCSSPASREAMVPSGVVLNKHFQNSVRVQTGGGSETGALDSTNISDADLKLAIEMRLSSPGCSRQWFRALTVIMN